MNNPYQNYLNQTQPYNSPSQMQQQMQQQRPMLQQPQSIVRVNGTGGASAYQMGINSSVLLLDESQPVIWLKTTDGAGYPTIQGYKISPLEEPKQQVEQTQVISDDINKRITLLENIAENSNKILNKLVGGMTHESNAATSDAKSKSKPKSVESSD